MQNFIFFLPEFFLIIILLSLCILIPFLSNKYIYKYTNIINFVHIFIIINFLIYIFLNINSIGLKENIIFNFIFLNNNINIFFKIFIIFISILLLIIFIYYIYFFLSSVSLGFYLFGVSLIYYFTGTTKINELYYIFLFKNDNIIFENFFSLGLVFICLSFFFKLSIAPFNFWAPDVYLSMDRAVLLIFAIIPKISILIFFFKINFYILKNFLHY